MYFQVRSIVRKNINWRDTLQTTQTTACPCEFGVVVCCYCFGVLSPVSGGKDKKFKHDVDSEEEESGELFQLHSEGTLAEVIDLDSLPEVKRVACAGDRLMILMTDTSVAQKWKIDQVVLGGPQWGCNATRKRPEGTGIYVKIARIYFPLDGQITIHHLPAGPFDMLEEANIHFHYEPGIAKQKHLATDEKKRRFRRALSNLVSNILNNIDWHANFTTTIPFLVGSDDIDPWVPGNNSHIGTTSSSPLTSSTSSEGNYSNLTTDAPTLALHKNWGDRKLSVTRRRKVKKVDDDFVLSLDRLNGDSQLSYTFDLVIKNIEGAPQLVRYISQFDIESNIQTDSTIHFKREIGLTYNTSLYETPMTELFRVPVATVRGLPPMYLTVSYQAQTLASVKAYSAGKTSLRTAFNGTGFVTASQQYDPVTKIGSQVSSRDWSIQPQEQSLASRFLTEADFSVYQKFHFFSAVSWHYHDVDIELSPPVELSVHPEVHLRSSSPGLARCVDSDVTINSHVHTERAQFTADAFGLKLWDVPLQPAMTFDIHLFNASVGHGCDARCHGNSERTFNVTNGTYQMANLTRGEVEFNKLRTFNGDLSQFMDPSSTSSWCGIPGASCFLCVNHSLVTPKERTCSSRLMTSRMAAALTQLSDLVTVEWPDKQLLILEVLDEPTSSNPAGVHEPLSLYKQGRAASVTLTPRLPVLSTSPTPLKLDTLTIDRLGQLAVCAGLESVHQVADKGMLELAVEMEGFESPSKDDVEKRTMFWQAMKSLDVSSLSPMCAQAPPMTVGSQWPQQTADPEDVCGPVERPLLRADRTHMKRLIYWNLTDSPIAFESEGQREHWCGRPSRQCLDCTIITDSLEPWDWCSTRMMTPRLAIRLRKLQKLAKEKGFGSIVAGQSTIHAAFVKQRTKQTEKDNVDLKCKLNTAYVLAKEELPFTKFKPLLDLQKKNGLDISSTYAKHVMAAELVHTISETFKDEGCIGLREDLQVLQAFTESSQHGRQLEFSLYNEGRGIKLATLPAGREKDLASLAVCAGFDYVKYSNQQFIEAFVKAQSGYQTLIVSYFEGPSRAEVSPIDKDTDEYTYPVDLDKETVLPVLLDGSVLPDTHISEHVNLSDVMSTGKRYFRLDTSLLECIELAEEDFTGTVELLSNSVYRTRSVNFLHNLDTRHEEEKWRFQAGLAMAIRPAGASSPESLLALATSVLRECPAVVRLQMRAVGLGCHSDHLYVDLRPLIPGHEREYVTVWEAESTHYCSHVMKLQRDMIQGGPVVQSTPSITCRDRGLDPGLEFLSFQIGQESHCNVEGQDEFCRASRAAREKAADELQKLLTSAAGYGRLPRYELIGEIRACLVDVCGGCAGVGPVFDQKVRACSRLVHKYLERAASPFPDLANVTTFFNTDTALSTVHGLACQEGHVCVENTPAYSLFVPTVTARYYPDPKKSLERELFSADINPTPLLELVAQEMAFRAKGKVTVYIEAEKDTYALRNTLKVLMAYNKNVTMIEFQVASGIDADLVTSSIQRKLEAWSGVACPLFSRFAMTPFTLVTLETERHRRSAEMSVPRNKVKSRIYNWEREWLDKMF